MFAIEEWNFSTNSKEVIMEIIIGKHFTFDSSHILPDQAIYGKCSNLHGHTYKLTVEITGEMDYLEGWICNFSEVKKIVQEKIIDKLDHNHLNNIIVLPTAENIILWIAGELKKALLNEEYSLKSLVLYETPTSFARLEL